VTHILNMHFLIGDFFNLSGLAISGNFLSCFARAPSPIRQYKKHASTFYDLHSDFGKFILSWIYSALGQALGRSLPAGLLFMLVRSRVRAISKSNMWTSLTIFSLWATLVWTMNCAQKYIIDRTDRDLLPHMFTTCTIVINYICTYTGYIIFKIKNPTDSYLNIGLIDSKFKEESCCGPGSHSKEITRCTCKTSEDWHVYKETQNLITVIYMS
jgi:hypothetical protein